MKNNQPISSFLKSHTTFILILLAAFLLRLSFGLCSDIWYQIQLYTLGLKFYSTGLWPYFGPSVAWGIQLPGALQALAIGLPMKICPIPEAPIILINILSFSGICLFAWYCTKRLPSFPAWIIWAWLLIAPWTVDWSTNLDNVSYLLVGSVLFFIGFMETISPLPGESSPPIWQTS